MVLTPYQENDIAECVANKRCDYLFNELSDALLKSHGEMLAVQRKAIFDTHRERLAIQRKALLASHEEMLAVQRKALLASHGKRLAAQRNALLESYAGVNRVLYEARYRLY